MKKFIAVVLAVVICVTMRMGVTAQDALSIPMQQITILQEQFADLEQFIDDYQLQPQTANTLRTLVAKHRQGIISLPSLTIQIPSTRARGVRTYIGFANKTYYEETVVAPSTNKLVDIGQGYWAEYMQNTVEAGIEYLIDSTLDYATGGYWSIINIFTQFPNGVSANTYVTHQAQIATEKIIKHTYILENGQYHFGSLTEKASFVCARNYLNIPGYGLAANGDIMLPAPETRNYDSADQRAYYAYLSGGQVERINGYYWGGVFFRDW